MKRCARLVVDQASRRLNNFFDASVGLMQVMAHGAGRLLIVSIEDGRTIESVPPAETTG